MTFFITPQQPQSEFFCMYIYIHIFELHFFTRKLHAMGNILHLYIYNQKGKFKAISKKQLKWKVAVLFVVSSLFPPLLLRLCQVPCCITLKDVPR